MKHVDELLESLRRYGTVDSEGQFTVSLSEARRKLKQYHSSQPGRYMLLLVSAGIAAGAKGVAIERRKNGYCLRFDQADLSERELLQTLAKPHSAPQNSAASDFVLGLQGAFTQKVLEIQVRVSASSGASYFWTLRPDADHSEALAPQDWRGVEVVLTWEPTWSVRFRSFLASLGGYAGMSSEERLVDRYGDRALVPVTVNGQSVSRPICVPGSLANVVVGDIADHHLGFSPDHRIGSPRWRAALALDDGSVTLVVNGIASGQVESLGLSGTVYRDDLVRDVGKEQLVLNDVYRGLLEELQGVRYRLFDVLAGKLEGLGLTEVSPYLAELVHLFLVGRLSGQSRKLVWSWMDATARFAEKSVAARPSVAGLMNLTQMLAPNDVAEVVTSVVEDCAEAIAQRHRGALTLITTTSGMLKTLPGPPQDLMQGYLLLASGALQALNGNTSQSEKDWFLALKTAWSCQSEQAQELFHTHLGYPEEHVARQAASVLRMFGRSFAPVGGSPQLPS